MDCPLFFFSNHRPAGVGAAERGARVECLQKCERYSMGKVDCIPKPGRQPLELFLYFTQHE